MSNFSDKLIELYPWIRARARMYFKSQSDADDLVSETMLRLLQNHAKYDHSMDLKPWCLVVMKNIYCNWYQRRMSISFVQLEDSHTSICGDNTDYDEMVEIMALQSCKSLNVHCVDLYAQGYSYEEISVMLNIKIGTVRSRIFNGRKLLRGVLEV